MANHNRPTPHRKFGMRDNLGYLFGDFGNDFTFILSTTILMKFYTDVMGVSAGVVGTLMMLARFVDAVTDVTMGRICDASKRTKAGKFKPWLLRMCVPVALSSFLMYAPGLDANIAHNWSYGVRTGWLIVTYLLWGSFCYTGINIPYGSMASAISPNAGDRASLSTFRTLGGTLAGIFIGVGLPLFAYKTIRLENGGTQDVLSGQNVAIAAGVFSILAILCYLLCYKMCTERVVSDKIAEKGPSVGQMLGSALRNRALISIIVASVFMLLAQLTMQNMMSYVYPDYYNAAYLQSVGSLTMVLGMGTAAAIAKPVTTRYGKAEVSSLCSVAGAIVCLAIWIIRPNVYVYMAMTSLFWLFLGVFSMVNWALITDVIDYSELKNGIREDGSVYAMYSFARKLGQALASGLSGWLLTAIAYNENALAEGVAQTDAVKNGIFTISTLVPAIGFILLAAVLWFWYPLHKKQVDANIMALKKKHGDSH
ncbi:MAG: MFS transporter [Oscillospiraceae bacterium]|nr:MFS transporter [Oscillospiraceae bacterium]